VTRGMGRSGSGVLPARRLKTGRETRVLVRRSCETEFKHVAGKRRDAYLVAAIGRNWRGPPLLWTRSCFSQGFDFSPIPHQMKP
jgi:hypothetical protein